MEKYKLKADEVVLYKNADVYFSNENAQVFLMLTNHAVVMQVTAKKLLQEVEEYSLVYPKENIKVYHGEPQVKQKGAVVEIYFTDAEYELEFSAKKEAHKFVVECLNLLTEKTSFERGVGKVKDSIAVVDDTLGINTVEAVKAGAKVGLNGWLKGVGKKRGLCWPML